MRPVRKITSDEENLREVEIGKNMVTFKRDPVEPEPVGTIILTAFRITGYDKDCDGSLMARLEHIDLRGRTTGWKVKNVGIRPDSDIVVSDDELKELCECQD